MANIKNNASSQETRRKLVDAAGKLFASRGLHAATLKEITDLADVNPAAVNYHFSDKFELYAAVVRHALAQTTALSEDQRSGSPEDRFRALIASALRELHDPARPAWRFTLVAHELAQPTAAMEAVMDELIWPRVRILKGLIREIVGSSASEGDVSRGTFSVVAQVEHYLYQHSLLRRCEPELARPDYVDDLAAHIAEFSLAGLYAMRDQCIGAASRRAKARHVAPHKSGRARARSRTGESL